MSSELLPPNSTDQEIAIADATNRTIEARLHTLWSANDIDAAALPWLAWALSVDEWSEYWTEEQKRAVVLQSLAVHRKKGTIGAIVTAVTALNLGITVIESATEPYTFTLDFTSSESISNEQLAGAINTALSAKNARSHLSTPSITRSLSTPFPIKVLGQLTIHNAVA